MSQSERRVRERKTYRDEMRTGFSVYSSFYLFIKNYLRVGVGRSELRERATRFNFNLFVFHVVEC